MRWSLLLAVFGLSITDVASFAQRPPDDQRLALTQSSYQDAGFFASTGVVRFQLVQGRLCLDAPRHRKGSQNRDEDGVYESITVTAERGIPSLHYVCQSPDHHLTLSVQKADAVRIESWFPKTSERSVLNQPAIGSITWTHSHGELNQHSEGLTLLHIRNADPTNFDLHCGLLIHRLLRGQSLCSLSDATKTVMLHQLASTELPDVATIHENIEQLRSRRRSQRMAAERQLLAWGTPIIPAIHQLSDEDLDAEQAERMRCILHRLRPRVDDTPSTLAKLLVNDQTYWSGISSSLSGDQISLANQHLKRFGVQPISLAPTPEARIAASSESRNDY